MRPEEDVARYSGAGVTGGFETPDMGARNSGSLQDISLTTDNLCSPNLTRYSKIK